jgi:hypothetical protein
MVRREYNDGGANAVGCCSMSMEESAAAAATNNPAGVINETIAFYEMDTISNTSDPGPAYAPPRIDEGFG